ncbi:MAG: acyl--CoA ligase [Nitrosomonadales bacterium]|nr:acyl--CoA ligase [Nitrosomonadales bacterium]
MNLIDVIKLAAFSKPAAPAFIFDGRVLSYRKFYSLLCAVARTMHEQGVRPGDMVGLSMVRAPLHCVAMLALARLGAVSVPVHPLLPQSSKEKIVSKFGVRTMVSFNGDHGIAGIKNIRLDAVPTGTNEMDMGFTDYVPDAATPFRISLSSGTTGDPKGEMLTHGHLLDRIEKMLCDCDSDFRVMPFDINFALGFTFAIGALTIGGTVVFPNSSSPQDEMASINLHAVTHVFLPPAVITQMLALLPDDGVAFPSLKHLRSVGSATPPALLDALRARFTPNVFTAYGLTELGPVSIATPDILAVWPRSSGKILPWVQVDVLDESAQVLPLGASGEIRVKVEGMPTEYYGDAQETARKFRDGWFYTGDRGQITAEGLLFIEGRIDEVINLGGHKVNPVYMEEILARHPQVAEAAVFVMNDDAAVPFLAAALMPRVPEINLDDVAEHARRQLGLFQPKQFFIMQNFPRTPNGKLIRAELSATVSRVRNIGQQGNAS